MKTQEEIRKMAEKFAYAVDGSKEGEQSSAFGYEMGYTKCQEDMADKKYTESQLRDAIRNTITYLATISETGKFHSGNIVEEAIIQSLNKQD